MANAENKQFLKLEDAVETCKYQGKACLWHTDGCAIQFNEKIPENSNIESTLVLVSDNGSCLIMLVCISKKEAKSTIVVAGNFFSLQQLKSHHPHLFELMGTLCVR